MSRATQLLPLQAFMALTVVTLPLPYSSLVAVMRISNSTSALQNTYTPY